MLTQGKLREFEPIFYPRSVAVVGASKDVRKAGAKYLRTIQLAHFPGRVYPVNPSRSEILGLKAYPNVASIPDEVDNVIITVPPSLILDVLDDCAVKKVKVVQIFTAGFSEGQDEEGHRLEEKIIKKAHDGGFRVIGPNCIGACCLASKLPYGWATPVEEGGSISFISQSGGYGGSLFELSRSRGMRFSKIISYGNGCDLDSTDFLEYFGVDPETRIIVAYLEGVQDGQRFFRVMRQVSSKKPLIIWKGGQTGVGSQVADSHTGALAGRGVVWAAALKQAGAIEVGSFEELADTALAFQDMWRPGGSRMGIITGFMGAGGGLCVAAADACIAAGLEVPPLAEETRKRLEALLPAGGSILRNPVDITPAGFSLDVLETLGRVLSIMEADPGTDVIMLILRVELVILNISEEDVFQPNRLLIEFARSGRKPLVVVSPVPPSTGEQLALERQLSEAQIAVYPTLQRAARAISNVTRYWERIEGEADSG